MTRLLCVIVALSLCPGFLFSQNDNFRLFGISSRGGANNSGTVFSLPPAGNGFDLVHSFHPAGPFSPLGAVTLASDGNIYGTALGGGEQNDGIIFRLAPAGTGFTVLHSFGQAAGAAPACPLTEASDGLLYGSTVFGGAGNAGVLFRLAKDGSGYTVLHEFEGSDGARCYHGLTEASNGMLYGVTQAGGTFDNGTLFRLNKNGTGFTVLRHFELLAEGGNLYGQLLEDADGYLYATMADGGANGAGGVFRIRLDGSGFAVLKSFGFSISEGATPLGTLLEASNGRLYGTTASGGADFKGTVFSLEKDGSDFVNVHSFVGQQGFLPLLGNRLLEGTDGQLYGVNFAGGNSNAGTVYRLGLEGSGFAKIYDFENFDGKGPYPGLVETADGSLLGTTSLGGVGGQGTVFRLEKDGSGFAALHEFEAVNTDGFSPVAKPLLASDGWLYSTTRSGGAEGGGTAFRLDPRVNGSLQVLHSFGPDSGSSPLGQLIEGADGLLYGTASEGGTFDRGTVFRLASDGSEFEVIHLFSPNQQDGALPQGGLLPTPDGILYGTTLSGGEFGAGSVFRLGMDGTGYAQIFSFNFNSTGYSPNDRLTLGSDGKLYGLTTIGGPEAVPLPSGTAFRMNLDGSGFTVLHTFDREANGYPSGPLVEGPNGFLYGNTTNGAAFESGSTYRLAKDGSGFELLFEFDVANGISPQGELLPDPSGTWLYGITRLGGSSDNGVVFRISPDGSVFEKILDLEGYPTGSTMPDGGLVWVESPSAATGHTLLTGLHIAPNPASGPVQFFWENDFPGHEPAEVCITNGQGRPVFRWHGNLPPANALLQVQSRAWPSGTYFVEVRMEEGVFGEKIIVQR